MGCCLSFCHARPDTFPRPDVPEPSAPAAARQLLMTSVPSPLSEDGLISRDSSSNSDSTAVTADVKGKPLKRVACKWTSPVELDRDSWCRRRREFWETAPSFGGSGAVWQALRMAIAVGGGPIDTDDNVEKRVCDLATAQTILNCAGIILPRGSLREAYDERGYRYTIPVYCLADPINLANAPQSKMIANHALLPADRIMIRLPDGRDVALEGVQGDWTVARLRERLPELQQDLLFWRGKGPLPDTTRIADLGWTDPECRMQVWPKK